MNDRQTSKEFSSLVQRDDIDEHDLAIVDRLLNIKDCHLSELVKPIEKCTEMKTVDVQQKNQLLPSNENKKIRFSKQFTHLRSLIEKITRLQLTKHALIMIIINILMMGILIIVAQLSKRSSVDIPIDSEEILLVKRGEPHGGPGGEDLWDDAEIATLRFNDTINRVMGSQSVDLSGEPLLLSLTFGYSNERSGREYGGIGRGATWEDLNPLELAPEEHIDHITIYEGYRNITNSWREGKLTYIIVGIYFKTDHNQEILYGSTNGIRKEESPKNYFLAYAQGRAVGFIDSLRFTWYKYCLKNATIIEHNLL